MIDQIGFMNEETEEFQIIKDIGEALSLTWIILPFV